MSQSNISTPLDVGTERSRSTKPSHHTWDYWDDTPHDILLVFLLDLRELPVAVTRGQQSHK